MTAHELAQKLLAGPDLPVHTAYPAGDYWRTTITPPIVQVATETVIHSSYHQQDVVADEDDDRRAARRVIVLK